MIDHAHAMHLRTPLEVNPDTLNRHADQGPYHGRGPCGLSCATALRGARKSYSSTEPAEVVATMSGWWRETAMTLHHGP